MRTRAATSGRMNATAAKQQIPSSYQLGESRLVYEYGKVVGEDQEYIKQSIDAFNAHPDIQLKCEHLEEAGLRYLRFTSLHGTGIAAREDVPQGTELYYYLGEVYDADHNPVGNHCLDIGRSGRTLLCVNASRVPKNLPLGSSMHMANHSCNPNCRATSYEPENWNNDLVLLMLVAIRDIKSGEAITFQYKGTMWQPIAMLPSFAPPGFQSSTDRVRM